jgi:hypothetical protein
VAKTKAATFAKEADLCAAFIESAKRDGTWIDAPGADAGVLV